MPTSPPPPLQSEITLLPAVWCVLAGVQSARPDCEGTAASFGLACLLTATWPRPCGQSRRRPPGSGPRRPALPRLLLCTAAGFVLHPWLAAIAVSCFEAASGRPVALAAPGPVCATESLALLVLGPVFEECLYRGRLLGVLQPRIGAVAAVATTAACFALPHVRPLHVFGAFLAGLVLGAVRIATRRVVPCIALHVGLNLAAVGPRLALGHPS